MQLDDDARDAKQQFSLTNYLGQIMGFNGLKEKTEWIFKLRLEFICALISSKMWGLWI